MRKFVNYSEEQVLEIIERVVGRIAGKFKFGYYDVEDIKQEGCILALNALESRRADNGEYSYDESRPLENYLSIYIKNRLINLRRDKFFRHQKPCQGCQFYDAFCKKSKSECTAFTDKMECDLFRGWFETNNSKKNLVEPIDIYTVNDEQEKNTKFYIDVDSKIDYEHLKKYIDQKIPISMRADYLKIISNTDARRANKSVVSLNRQHEIRQVIAGIIEEYNADRA